MGQRGPRRGDFNGGAAALSDFRAWLRERVQADPRPRAVIAAAVGIGYSTLANLMRDGTVRPSENMVKLLARSFGENDAVTLERFGFTATGVIAPNPREFPTIGSWLEAALKARRLAPTRASVLAGLSGPTLGAILKGAPFPEKPTLVKITRFFDVDPAELLAMRRKNPNRVARGAKNAAAFVEGLDEEAAKEAFAKRVRAGYAVFRDSPEAAEHSAKSSVTGIVAARTRGDAFGPMQEKAIALRNKRRAERDGLYYRSQETRDAAAAAIRASGGPQRGGQATLERHGTEHFKRASEIANAKKRNAELIECVFCNGAQGPPVKRVLAQRLRKDPKTGKHRPAGAYHLECFRNWRRDPLMRGKSHDWGTLGQVRQRVLTFGTAQLLRRFDEEMAKELRRLRNPNATGRPPALLKNLPFAREAARLHYVEGVTAVAVCKLLGLSTVQVAHGAPEAGRKAYELMEIGRALLGISDSGGGSQAVA